MKKVRVLCCLILMMAGCAHSPIESLDHRPKAFPSIRELINKKPKVVVLFLHGVGDHCPGYALDNATGWIKGKALRGLGRPRGYQVSSNVFDRVETEFYLSPHDPNLYVGGNDMPSLPVEVGQLQVYRRRMQHVFGANPTSVDTVEITWSGSTRAVKDDELIYDFTERSRHRYANQPEQPPTGESQSIAIGQEAEPCPQPTAAADIPSDIPSRAYINGSIKEQIFDRDLADAILYSGPFNRIIQHVVAEGICDAITMSALEPGQPLRRAKCDWGRAKQLVSQQDTAYIFITHSLGSRILFNIFMNLDGQNPYDTAFKNKAATDPDYEASEAIKKLTCQTPAIYMMANQIALLRLATGAATDDIIASDPKNRAVSDASAFLPGFYGTLERDINTARFERLPPCEGRDAVKSGAKPTFVAFTDTNDLLSWPIRSDTYSEVFDFFNVFVDNSTWHWLGLYEDAATAHTGYFDNAYVGEIIACGVNGGSVGHACDSKAW